MVVQDAHKQEDRTMHNQILKTGTDAARLAIVSLERPQKTSTNPVNPDSQEESFVPEYHRIANNAALELIEALRRSKALQQPLEESVTQLKPS
jgi:hypothetical protein